MKSTILLTSLLLVQFLSFSQTHSILKNIASGDDYGIPASNQATFWNGKTYFIATPTPSDYTRIWSTDGTTANTVGVLTSDYPDIRYLTSINNGLIFNGYKNSNPGVFRSNGTQSGTSSLTEFPGQEIVFMQKLNDTLVIFLLQDGDTTSVWSTNGTVVGTVKLGNFEIKSDYLRTSYFKGNMIFTEKSTNFDLFPPVITDGTPSGTKLVNDFINDALPGVVSGVTSAVGTTDFLFVQTSGGGKVFDGTTITNFPLSSDYNHGFKIGHLNVVFSAFDIVVYDSLDKSTKNLPVEPYYFSEPISNSTKVFFHNNASYLYETDGTAAGTKKISSLTAGEFNYDPFLFYTQDLVLYSANRNSNTELWIIDLNTYTDSLFSVIKPSNNPIVNPYAFRTGDHIIYPRYTATYGREYWVYNLFTTATKDLPGFQPISISPNPFTDEVNVFLGNNNPGSSNLSVYNTSGQMLMNQIIYADHYKLNMQGLNPGLYIIQVVTSDGVKYRGTAVKI